MPYLLFALLFGCLVIWIIYKATTRVRLSPLDLEYLALAKSLGGPPWPTADSKGNSFENIIEEDVAGLTHKQAGVNPVTVLNKLKNGEQVALIPAPDNQFDPDAIKVCTLNGRQFGWYPKNGCRRDEINLRLLQKLEVWAEIRDYGQRKNGTWWCAIRVCYYVIPHNNTLSKTTKNK